jgi:hypothetical protein
MKRTMKYVTLAMHQATRVASVREYGRRRFGSEPSSYFYRSTIMQMPGRARPAVKSTWVGTGLSAAEWPASAAARGKLAADWLDPLSLEQTFEVGHCVRRQSDGEQNALGSCPYSALPDRAILRSL